MHILKVSPNAEFKVRDELHRLDLPALVPVEFSVSVFGRGKQTIRKRPVVRGYVFAALTDADWHRLAAIREVHGALWIDGRPAKLTPVQVSALELLSQPLCLPDESRARVGDRVRIRRGAWAELEAIVTAIKRGRVTVTTEMFGRSMTTTVAADNVEAA